MGLTLTGERVIPPDEVLDEVVKELTTQLGRKPSNAEVEQTYDNLGMPVVGDAAVPENQVFE